MRMWESEIVRERERVLSKHRKMKTLCDEKKTTGKCWRDRQYKIEKEKEKERRGGSGAS